MSLPDEKSNFGNGANGDGRDKCDDCPRKEGNMCDYKRLSDRLGGRQSVTRLQISEGQKAALYSAISGACVGLTDPQRQALVCEAVARSVISSVLDEGQCQTIEQFASPAYATALVIENLPIGNFGETPRDGLRPLDKDLISELVLYGFAAMLGHVLGFREEKKGEIVQQVVPIDSIKVKNSNASRDKFGFHVDNIFLKPQFRQEFIGLLCLRNPSGAATLLLDLLDLMNAMPDEMFDWAWKPRCRFPVSDSFDMGGVVIYSEPRALFYLGTDGLPRINAKTYGMLGITTEDDEMIKKFCALSNSVKPTRVVLSPGELLLFHDDFAMHGRDAFEGDRWLQRVYVRFDLNALWNVGGNRAARTFDAKQLLFAA
jgi:hypothetical protein